MGRQYTGLYCARCGLAQTATRLRETCPGLVKGKRCGSMNYTPEFNLIDWSTLNDKDADMLRSLRIARAEATR